MDGSVLAAAGGIAVRGRIGARGGGRLRNLAPDAEASVAFGQSSPPAVAALRSVHGRLLGGEEGSGAVYGRLGCSFGRGGFEMTREGFVT